MHRDEASWSAPKAPPYVGTGKAFALAVVLAFSGGRAAVAEELGGSTPPMSSASYEIRHATTAAGAGGAEKTGLRTIASAASTGTPGSASTCNRGSRSTVGAYSLLGEAAVPIELAIRRNAIHVTDVDLSWSGAAPTFEVYRSNRPDNVLDPANLYRRISRCGVADQQSSPAAVYYFQVVEAP